MDSDGLLEMVTGSNCCANRWFHWFDLDDQGNFSKRHDVQLTIDSELYRIGGKTETRPFILDWNRDGFEDLVVVLRIDSTNYEDQENIEYRIRDRIFVNASSPNRSTQIEQGQRKKASLSDEERYQDRQLGGPEKGPDLKMNARIIQLGHQEKLEDRYVQAQNDGRYVHVRFAFADFDLDGSFDVLFSENIAKREWNESKRRYLDNQRECAIYWMRNLKPTGEPKFAAPLKIMEVPDQWQVQSMAVGDFDLDRRQDVVVSLRSVGSPDVQHVVQLLQQKRD